MDGSIVLGSSQCKRLLGIYRRLVVSVRLGEAA